MEIGRWLCCAVFSCALVCYVAAKPVSLNKIIEAESRLEQDLQTTISPKLKGFADKPFSLKDIIGTKRQKKQSLHSTIKPKLKGVVTKPVPLNDIIGAESKQEQFVETRITPKSQSKLESVAERFSLNRAPRPQSQKSKKFKGITGFSLDQKLSPLKYRKTFQIKSPLKPKRIKYNLRTRHTRRNQSVKREIGGNAEINQKYIPLLRSLGMLFDNILGADSSESIEVTKNKNKRFKYYSEDDEVSCKCTSQGNAHEESESEEKTDFVPEAISADVSLAAEASTETADSTSSSNVRGLRPNKNVPILLPRDTISSRGNYIGFSERSDASHNGSVERNITRHHGTSEYHPEFGQDESCAENDEELSDCDPRDDAGSARSRTGVRGDRDEVRGANNTEEIATYEGFNVDDSKSKDEIPLDDSGRHLNEHKRKDQLETEGNDTESAELLSEPVRRLRGGLPSEDKIVKSTESIQPQEDYEESDLNVAQYSSSDQRVIDRDGSHTKEDQKASSRHEAVIPSNNQTKPLKLSKSKGPVVVIIDGYSVTRHKNGENKLAEKAIHIRNN